MGAPWESGRGDQLKGKWKLGGSRVDDLQDLMEYHKDAMRLCAWHKEHSQ